MKQKQNAGFSLVEVLVSIVILALVVVPLCTGLVMSVRMNAKADALLQAQLAVSSEIEKLMATGIDWESLEETYTPEQLEDGVKVITVTNSNIAIAIKTVASTPYYNVTVSYDEDPETDGEYLVSVSTTIRKGGGGE